MKKPTIEDIQGYMTEKGFIIQDQAETFFDHFESKGWMVGKSKMKCWKAATRNWIRNAKKWSNRNETRQSSNQTHSQRQHEQAQQAFGEMETGDTEGNSRPIRPIQ